MPFSGPLGISPSDVAISLDGSLIYAAGKANSAFFPYLDGNLRIYDSVTGQLVTTLAIGTSLGAVDLSPDGSFLMVTELRPAAGMATVYKVDLTTLTFQTFNLAAPTSNQTPFYDVAVLSNGSVLLSVGLSGSNPEQTKILDVSTGTFSNGPLLQAHAYLTPAEDGSAVLVGECFLSPNSIMTYVPGEGVVATNNPNADGAVSGGASRQAINVNTGLIAEYANGLQIYDENMHHLGTLSTNFVDGMTFDRSGEFLYVTDFTTQSIIQYSTLNWAVVQTINVGQSFGGGRDTFGGTLTLSPDGSFFAVIGASSNPDASQLLEVANPGLLVTPGATSGADTLSGTAGIDVLNGLGGNDSISSGAGKDFLQGGDGNDAISGGDDDDAISGGAGNDTIDGGAGNDTASYADAAAVVVNLSTAIAQDTGGAGVDTLISIENVYGSAFADRLTGDSGANIIRGQAGDDTLVGGAGNDELNGGAGTDTVDYSQESGSGNILVNLGATAIAIGNGPMVGSGQALDSYGSFDTLSSVEHIITGAGNDTVFGSGGSELIETGAGDDLIRGGGGADILVGGAGNDSYSISDVSAVVIENAGEGTDKITSSISYTLGANVENLTLSGAANINGTGNDLANNVFGNTGANFLNGLDGDDRIFGSLGADTLTGGAGNDTFLDTAAGLNGDTITDFSRGDRILITDATLAGFTFMLSGNQLTFTGGSLTLSNLNYASIAASAAPNGGVQITFAGPPIILSAGASASLAASASASAQSAQAIAMVPPNQLLDRPDFLDDRPDGWHAGISHWKALHSSQADLFALG